MIQVVDNRWYSGGTGTVGFVLVYDELLKQYNCYSGVSTEFGDEQTDIERIKDYGAKVEQSVAQAMFPLKDLTNYKV